MKGYINTYINVSRNDFKDHVFIIVGDCPEWFNDNVDNLIYTELSRPKPNDAKFLKGQVVHLIHGTNATDELFAKWFVEVSNAKPKTLLATDCTEEMMVCNF